MQLIVGLNDWTYGRTQGSKDSVVGAATRFLGFSTCNKRWPAAKPSHHSPYRLAFEVAHKPYAVSSASFGSNLSMPRPKSTTRQPFDFLKTNNLGLVHEDGKKEH